MVSGVADVASHTDDWFAVAFLSAKAMDKKPKKRRSRRKKKILSPHSLQDLADADRELIASSTRRTISAISDLNEMSALTPHSSSNFLVGDGNIFQETDGVKVNNKSADSDLQKFSKSKAQHVPLESPPQQTRTRFNSLPTLNTQIEVGKSAEKIVDKVIDFPSHDS